MSSATGGSSRPGDPQAARRRLTPHCFERTTALFAGVQAHGPCSPGYTLSFYRFAWTTTAEDFHGNKAVGSTQQIVYP